MILKFFIMTSRTENFISLSKNTPIKLMAFSLLLIASITISIAAIRVAAIIRSCPIFSIPFKIGFTYFNRRLFKSKIPNKSPIVYSLFFLFTSQFLYSFIQQFKHSLSVRLFHFYLVGLFKIFQSL